MWGVRRVSADKASLDREAVNLQLERILASADWMPRQAPGRSSGSSSRRRSQAGRSNSPGLRSQRGSSRGARTRPGGGPIVRIQAGRLRRSLERYYLMSGARTRFVSSCRVGRMPRRTQFGQSPPAPARRRPRPGRTGCDGWPSVVARMFIDGSPELKPSLLRLNEQLCVEMGHYGDVRVVRRRTGPAVVPRPRRLRAAGARRVRRGRHADDGAPAGLRECEPVWAEDYRGPWTRRTAAMSRPDARSRRDRLREPGRRQAALERARRPAIDELPANGAICAPTSSS